MSLPQTMRAVVCAHPGPVDVLQIQRIPLPIPKAGEVLIKILGFGINRAEMFTRQGHSPITFPRIIGIECIGTIAGFPAPPPTPAPFALGTRVATCMGGLGRQIPGSYAEFVCVPADNVVEIPATTNLSIAQLAALPEMLQTTWGALTQSLDVRKGESLLIRGATSSIGLCALQLAKHKLGAGRVAGTTRQESRVGMLRESGADEVFIDDGNLAAQVAASGGGFDKVLELVGTTSLRDSIRCARTGGTVCMTGITGGQWEFEKVSPMELLPNRIKLCGYSGSQEDLKSMPFAELVKDFDKGILNFPVKEFKLEEIQEVHRIMESGGGGAKMAIVVADE